jgi:hypothetical protein
MNEAQLKQKPEDLSDEERIDRMIRRLKEMRHLTKILEQQNKEKGINLSADALEELKELKDLSC